MDLPVRERIDLYGYVDEYGDSMYVTTHNPQIVTFCSNAAEQAVIDLPLDEAMKLRDVLTRFLQDQDQSTCEP